AIPPSIGEDRVLSLIHGLYWLCANLADRGPLVLCVDDAHWADVPSLRFMHFLTRRIDGLGAAIVIGARPVGRKARSGELLAALAAEDACARLELSGLSEDAVSDVVTSELGEPEPAFATACHRLTGGNPLYIRELVRNARERGLAPSGRDAAALSELTPEG